ncbi:MAG: hypothetical protein ACLSVD_02720 [Eggerthellaceae bacterium]
MSGVRTNGQEYGHPDAITIEEGVEIASSTMLPGRLHQRDRLRLRSVPMQFALDLDVPSPDED